jgi:hypothetical protein
VSEHGEDSTVIVEAGGRSSLEKMLAMWASTVVRAVDNLTLNA